MADITNPDLFACGSRTWIRLDLARFYEEHCQPSSGSAWPVSPPKNGNRAPIAGGGMGDTICTGFARWEEVITSTNMAHNSRKAWKVYKEAIKWPTTYSHPCLLSANQVEIQFLAMTGVTCHKHQNVLYYPQQQDILSWYILSAKKCTGK